MCHISVICVSYPHKFRRFKKNDKIEETLENIEFSRVFEVLNLCNSLSLGELRCTTCALESVLLSFLHTRVTSEEASSLECGLVCLVSLYERSCKTVTDSACLTGKTAAVYVCDDIELTSSAGNTEGLVNDELEGLETEILVDVLLIDGDNACAGNYANTGNTLLSSTCAVEVGLRTCIHLRVLLT